MTLNKHSVLRFKPFNSKGSENINSKLTVLAIVSMMVLAGSAAILQMDDADAVVKDMTDKVIVLKSDDTVGHNVTLFTDEYKNSSYGYTMTWSITEIDHQKSQSDLDSILLQQQNEMNHLREDNGRLNVSVTALQQEKELLIAQKNQLTEKLESVRQAYNGLRQTVMEAYKRLDSTLEELKELRG